MKENARVGTEFCVEEARATSNSYQVQTRHRNRKREKRMLMLIGILIRSVTSKRSCALDGSPSCKRVESKRWERKGKTFETLDSVDIEIFVKSLNNVF